MKRIMVITPRFPYPVIGGDRLRIYHICRELSQHFIVDLYSLCESVDEMKMPPQNDGVFENVYKIHLPKKQSYINSFGGLFSSKPIQVAYYRSNELRRLITENSARYDLCIGHLVRVAEYLDYAPKQCIIEMTDAISMNYARIKGVGRLLDFRSWLFRIEANRLLKYERSIRNRASAVSLISEVDANYLFGNPLPRNVIICNNGVDLEGFKYSREYRRTKTIAFVGNLSSLQNLDACLYFIDEILPALRRHDSEIKLRVVGRMSDNVHERLLCFEGVEIAANVSSVSDALADVAVGIAPMRLGAGVQNKVLEYFALGIPAVVSELAHEGLSAIPGKDLLVCTVPAQYIQSILELLNDNDRAESLARSGRAYVENRHSWSQSLAPLITATKAILHA